MNAKAKNYSRFLLLYLPKVAVIKLPITGAIHKNLSCLSTVALNLIVRPKLLVGEISVFREKE